MKKIELCNAISSEQADERYVGIGFVPRFRPRINLQFKERRNSERKSQ